jgi:hypothetical protein
LKQPSLLLSLCALVAAVSLAGCGGGSGTPVPPPPAGRSVAGQALAPASLVGRALADPDVALPAATVTLTDVTNGLPGTVVNTTQTGLTGQYVSTGLVADHIYFLYISRQRKDSKGNTVTISMGAVVPPADSSGNATTNITPSTTVGLGFVLTNFDSLRSGKSAADALQGIFGAEDDVAQATEAAREAGTETVDLSEPANDPKSHGADAQKVNTQSRVSAAFLSGGNSKQTTVDMLFDKTSNQASATLFVRDNAGDIFDADTFTGPVDATGNFTGKTIDGIYTISGTITSKQVQGTWAAVDGSAKGSWSAKSSSGGRAAGYQGVFTRPQTGETGTWLMFVDNSGSTMIYGHRNKAGGVHLLDTVALAGTIKSDATIATNLAFPAESGSLSGTDPTQGASIVVPNAKASTLFGTLHGTITGSTSGTVVSGAWKLAGAFGSDTFDETGTWSGTKY